MIQRIKQKLGSVLSWPVELRRNSREAVWAARFNSTICGSRWFREIGLSPGNWAANYSLLYLIYRICNDMHPERILEFGLGQSSVMLCKYKEYFPETSLATIEHDPEWIDYFTAIHPELDLRSQIHQLPLEYRKELCGHRVIYQNLEQLISSKKFNFILIDGPVGSFFHSRIQILDLIPDHLAPSFVILFDDAERIGEKQTIHKVCRKLHKANIPFLTGYYEGNKSQQLLCSYDWKFLTGL